MNRKYTDEEVEQILKIALRSKTDSGAMSLDNIYDIAKELNIDPAAVQNAVNEFENRGDVDAIREEFIRKRRKGFFDHLTSYLVINSFLVILDLVTGNGINWAYFPLLGWGLGVFFDGMSKLRYDEEEFQKYYQKQIRKKKTNKLSKLFDAGVDVATDVLQNFTGNHRKHQNKRHW